MKSEVKTEDFKGEHEGEQDQTNSGEQLGVVHGGGALQTELPRPTQPRNAFLPQHESRERSVPLVHEHEQGPAGSSAASKSAGDQILSITAASASQRVPIPHIRDASYQSQTRARKDIEIYRMQVHNHNVQHGLNNPCLPVIFMLNRKVAKSLLEQVLLPSCKYCPTDPEQVLAIDNYFMQKQNTPFVSTKIRMKEFDARTANLQMDMRNRSWIDRLRAYLGAFQTAIEDCRVQIVPKVLVQKLLHGVMPPNLKKRLRNMLVAGSDTDKSAYYCPDKFKDLLRQETQKDYEAKVLLSDGNTHFPRSQSRHSIHKVSKRSRRFSGQFQGQICVHRNPLRTISKIEIEADNWVEINPILPKHAPLRDLKEIIPLAPRIKIGDYDPHSLVSLVTAGNVGSRVINLMSVREGEDRNKTNMFRQDRRKNVIHEIADSDENTDSTMPEQQTSPNPKHQRR